MVIAKQAKVANAFKRCGLDWKEQQDYSYGERAKYWQSKHL
ncbi:malate synthase [Roseobacter sp. SK209-2-6]|nr:hypothetical protein [Roseobacter sp. SK209-2-6]EBA15181.1 malate synthase [Roseobacter sp. SK209-2-6]